MNPQIEFLCDAYVAYLLEQLSSKRRATCYLFDPATGGNATANSRILKALDGHNVEVVMIDKTDWEAVVR